MSRNDEQTKCRTYKSPSSRAKCCAKLKKRNIFCTRQFVSLIYYDLQVLVSLNFYPRYRSTKDQDSENLKLVTFLVGKMHIFWFLEHILVINQIKMMAINYVSYDVPFIQVWNQYKLEIPRYRQFFVIYKATCKIQSRHVTNLKLCKCSSFVMIQQ